MKHLLFLALLVCAACSTSPTPIAQRATDASSATVTVTPTPNRTATLVGIFAMRTATAQSEKTHQTATAASRKATVQAYTPTPTLTPTRTPVVFDPHTSGTYTPAPAALCPLVTPVQNPNLDFFVLDLGKEGVMEIEKNTLVFLNQFGSEPLIKALREQGRVADKDFAFQDFTYDGVPEFSFGAIVFYIMGCIDGKYQTLFETEVSGYSWPDSIVLVKDGNRNGLPEIILNGGYATQGWHEYQIIEWDGQQFSKLALPYYPHPDERAIPVKVGSSIGYRDLNHDGILEIVVQTGIPTWEIYTSGLPWRNETLYFKWDGRHYIRYASEFASPIYRFQAVQDADQFVLLGEYDRALDLYQQAIFSDTLEWWSPERRAFEQDHYYNPDTKPPSPFSNSSEYPQLAAYARYRIIVLHLLQGHTSAAQIVYDTLQEKFPAGNAGHPYAEMAAAFWASYQTTPQIASACAHAIAYAGQHPEILIPLGSDYHGDQSRQYKPEDVCPFN